MAVNLSNVASGYSTGVINNNFQQIEDLLNNNFLHRVLDQILANGCSDP